MYQICKEDGVVNRQLDNIFEPPGQNELIVQSVFFFRLTRPTDSYATLTLKYAKPILRKKPTVLQSIARAVSLCNFSLFLLLLASPADILRRASRVPSPRTSADLTGKKLRPIAADFQIWEVHFGP